MAVITQQQYQELLPGLLIIHHQHLPDHMLRLLFGCNPSAADITAALGSASATDGCGTVTNITFSDALLPLPVV